ncbi:MAG: glycosyl hydrolase [Acidobacteriia bacterium]|jgi:photosystem II stability/assembly factor-like uncharacterized protein|nr:glycosyl hydrolase [Terriglobia bacterium]
MAAKQWRNVRRIGILFLAFLVSGSGIAQAQRYDEKALAGLRWREIGPFRGGRAIAVAGIPGDPNTFYFGAVAGGVWKTTDGGNTWTPIFDKQPVASIGAIAVAPSDPNVIYVGTGEACIRGNISHGNGVYKSTDAGKTWQHVGLEDTRTIGALIVHPKNPDIAYVAALGHVYGPNTERGVFRTTDGGKTWEKVLYKDEKTGAIDIAFVPSNPRILFAALWEAHRTPWSLSSGGPGSGLYKSTDGGTSWRRLEGNGLPRGILGRIGVSVSGADPNRVWALIEAEDGGLYRSDDGGETWQLINADRTFRQRAWYYTHVVADPQNRETVYVLNVGLHRSTDGGRTFTTLRAPHGDHHGLWIDPTDPQRMINANDGGANITHNGGQTWTRQDNQPTAQFYHVITDDQFPYYIYGAQQDNSTVAIASRSDDGGIDRSDWYPVGGCESGYIAPLPDGSIVYAGCYGGQITRWERKTRQAQQISAWPENPMGQGAGELKHRFQWTAPILISPHDPKVLYHAAEVLFMSTDEGMSWTAISPDLTRNDRSKQGPSGGPITKDNTSVEYYNTIFTVVESPHERGTIWVGTDDGLVHITRDGGKTWQNITPRDLPEWSLISLLEVSPHDPATAYIAVDRHELDDYRPYIYKTNDYGKTWRKITNGIPENTFVRAVREDPKRRGLLYAGTETGVYVSFDDGANWQSLQLNLPTTPIHDLVVKRDDLIVATHGRSFWILDDLTPLQQIQPGIVAKDFHLYTPRVAYRIRGGGFGNDPATGANPPNGAILYYWLKSEPKGEMILEILDSRGRVIRKYTGKAGQASREQEAPLFGSGRDPQLPAQAGMHRFVWDLRHQGGVRVPRAVHWGGDPGTGPLALPGRYQVRLTVDGQTQTAPLEVKLDPRVSTSQADLEKQFELRSQIQDAVNEAHTAVNQIRDLRRQLQALRQRTGSDAKYRTLLDAIGTLEKNMAAVEEELIQVRSIARQDPLNYPVKLNDKLLALASVVESADRAPTKQSYAVFAKLRGELDVHLARWREIVARDVRAVNEAARSAGVEIVSVASGTPE